MTVYNVQMNRQCQAICFEYSFEGMNALRKFVGDDLMTFSKARHPGAKATTKINRNGTVITEGDWIVKEVKNGGIVVMTKAMFDLTFKIEGVAA